MLLPHILLLLYRCLFIFAVLIILLLFLCDGAEAGCTPGVVGRRSVVALPVQQPPQWHQGHRFLTQQLLLAVPEVTLTLQPLELAEGGGGILVEAVGDGLGLLWLANQYCMTPKHHRHVLDLVPVDPGQDFGPARVSAAVGDSVQRVKMDGFLFPRFVGTHPNPLWSHC